MDKMEKICTSGCEDLYPDWYYFLDKYIEMQNAYNDATGEWNAIRAEWAKFKANYEQALRSKLDVSWVNDSIATQYNGWTAGKTNNMIAGLSEHVDMLFDILNEGKMDKPGTVGKPGEFLAWDSTWKVPNGESARAICYDAAEFAENIWYIPKSLPKPSGTPGMFVDVLWTNGNASGLGYNVKLIWGAPGAVDNEVIVNTSVVTDDIKGDFVIPTQGTIRYQLAPSGDRVKWVYVSGNLIPRQYSSNTAAEIADKVVPGLVLSYLPGMDIYVQLDKGNTADLMRIVPDEGTPLPVYGNGVGTKSGTVPADYIMHLVNAGDHWQMVNSPGQDEGKWELIEEITVNSGSIKEIKRTNDPSGTPWNFSKIRIFFSLSSDWPTRYTLQSYLNSAKGEVAYIGPILELSAPNTFNTYAMQECIKDGNAFTKHGEAGAQGRPPAYIGTTNLKPDKFMVEYSPITSWYCKLYGKDFFSEGDKFTIWAVRA